MFFYKTDNGYIIRVRLTPNSSSCKVLGTTQDVNEDVFLKISVVSVPEKGKANKELINYLAKKLKIAKSDFEILSGEFALFENTSFKFENVTFVGETPCLKGLDGKVYEIEQIKVEKN